MKEASRTAAGHRRTRNDHAAETAEDYVEAIGDLTKQHGRCRVVDLARHFGVSHVTVTKILSRLQREGLVETQKYGPITLTERGKQLAARSRRRHQVVYQFLVAIGVSEANAAIDAEGIEHHVGSETLARLEEYAAAKLSRKSRRSVAKRPAPD
jgi:DtxR family manganese transport transcriptional regulator